MRFLIAIGILAALAGPAYGQHGFWQPDERVLISSFLNARGIATDQRLVFIATANGLEIYDQTFKRWQLPSTIEDGYPAMQGPGRIVYDARERGIWLLTDARSLYTWSPVMQRWDQRFEQDVPAEVRARLQRGADDRDPALAIMRNFAGRDAHGRTWRVSAVEPAERSGTYWAALLGGNFSFIDTRNLSSENLTFGTLTRGVSALAVAGGNLYFGGDGSGARMGITRADTALQRWQQYETRVGEGPQRRVNKLIMGANAMYAASPDGLFVLRGERWVRILDGDVRALAQSGGRTWVGTRGTLGWLDASDTFTRIELPLQTVAGLAAQGDTLWVAAEQGLYKVVDGAILPTGVSQQPTGVAAANNVVVVITRSGVHTWNGAQLSTPLRLTSLRVIGAPVSVTAIGDRFYIGGTAGLAEWNTRTDTWRHLTTPADIPEGPVFDVVEENGRLWLATPAGGLRLQWK
jgi:hypothetical protein